MSGQQTNLLLQNSLSAKFVILSLLFGAVAVTLISIPLGRQLNTYWLEERIHAAHLASLALEATADGMIDLPLQRRLLRHAGILGVTVRRDDGQTLMLGPDMPLDVDMSWRMAEEGLIAGVLLTARILFERSDGVMRVVGRSQMDDKPVVEIFMRTTVLRERVGTDIRRLFALGVFTTIFMTIALHLVLQVAVVRRLRAMTRNILWFRKAPEDNRRVIAPSGSLDEIGIAEQALQHMQVDVRNSLMTQAHLAAVGKAVSKVQHDLRAILSSAVVLSDHLEESADPDIRRIAPTMIQALERAVMMCMTTMSYARQRELPIAPSRFALADLVREILAAQSVVYTAQLVDMVPGALTVVADRDQLYRAIANVVRNALEAGAAEVRVSAEALEHAVSISIVDNGSGIPPAALPNLFVPFLGSARMGKTGLGLAIAREIMAAHGGTVELMDTGSGGTTFQLLLPAPPGE